MPFDVSKLKSKLIEFNAETFRYLHDFNRDKYNNLTTGASLLETELDKYTKVGEDGKFIKLTDEQFNSLLTIYNNFRNALKAAISSEDRDENSVKMSYASKRFLPFVEHDIAILENADLSAPKDLIEIMSEGMSKVLELPEDAEVTDNSAVRIENEEGELEEGRFRSSSQRKLILYYKASEMFGLGDKVQKVEPVMMVQGDNFLRGAFVKDVYGFKGSEADPEAPELELKVKNFENPAVFKDIADAQAMDYIFGVSGRKDSVRLRFSEAPDSVLTGFTLEAGESIFSEDPGLDLKDIGVISEGFYNFIEAQNEADFKERLKKIGATQEEADEAWTRLSRLKDKAEGDMAFFDNNIAAGYTSRGRIRVVKDLEWPVHTTANLAGIHQNGYFSVFSNIPAEAKNRFQNQNIVAAQPGNHEQAAQPGNHGQAAQPGNHEQAAPAEHPEVPVAKRPAAGIVRDTRDAVKLTIPYFKKITSYGGALSTRYPVSYKDGEQIKRGFFTSAREYDSIQTINAAFEKIISANKKYAEILSDVRDYYMTSFENLETIRSKIQGDRLPLPHGQLGYSQEEIDKLYADEQFLRAWEDLEKEVIEAVKWSKSNMEAGFGEKQRVELKNVAVSDISEALGVPELISKSYVMEVESGGRITEGIFMEYAEGIDIRKLPNNHPILGLNPRKLFLQFNDADALKSIADLQIIDYICLNYDRNPSNMIYKFEDIGTDTPIFKGVIGIDNDFSFGTRKLDSKKIMNKLSPLYCMLVISEEMVNKLKEAGMVNTLAEKMKQSGLREDEIEKMRDRVTMILEAVNNGKIRVVKKDDWAKEENTFDKLTSHGGGREDYNYFNRIKVKVCNVLRDKAANYQKKSNGALQNQPYDSEEHAVKFSQGMKVDSFGKNLTEDKEYRDLEKQVVEELRSSMESYVEELPEDITTGVNEKDAIRKIAESAEIMERHLGLADPLLQWSSSEYRAMKKANKAVKEFAAVIAKEMEDWEKRNAECIAAANRENNKNNNADDNNVRRVDDSLIDFNADDGGSENSDDGSLDIDVNRYCISEANRVKMTMLLNNLADAAAVYKAKKLKQFKEENRAPKDVEYRRLGANRSVAEKTYDIQCLFKASNFNKPMQWLHLEMNRAQTKLGTVNIGIFDNASIDEQKSKDKVNLPDGNLVSEDILSVTEVPGGMSYSYVPSVRDKKQFKETIAEILYYRILSETELKTKNDNRLLSALAPNKVRAGIKKIMEGKAFKNLMKNPANELRHYALERNPKMLTKLYKKELVKEKQRELKNVKKGKVAKEKPAPGKRF